MTFRLALAVLATSVQVLSAAEPEWNRTAAANYLDARQKAWFEWKAADAKGGPCLSCHTGMPYLMARPALRTSSSEPTKFESGLRNGLKARIESGREPTDDNGVEAVLAALFLADDPAAAEQAFDRMWSLQIKDGALAGAFPWYSLDLDPYETAESAYWGASVAALAVGKMPASYRSNPKVKRHVNALVAYLRKPADQPLHNRLAAAWASLKLPEVMTSTERGAIVEQLFNAQNADGGWTLQSLGPWGIHKEAPAQQSGSHNYATAYAAMIARELAPEDRRLPKALRWLGEHQDRATGTWPASSMNKVYKDGSMMAQFMTDVATGYAVVALSGSRR